MTVRGYSGNKAPSAPKGMPKGEALLWKQITDSFPSDWFRPSDQPLMLEMVRAIGMSEQLNAMIAECTDTNELKKLLSMRDQESRRAAAFATKLRMPPQSRSDRHLAGSLAKNYSGAVHEKTWLFGRSDDAEDRFFSDKSGRTQ